MCSIHDFLLSVVFNAVYKFLSNDFLHNLLMFFLYHNIDFSLFVCANVYLNWWQ